MSQSDMAGTIDFNIMTAHRSASLLGIAKELRLQIYEELLTSDLNCTVIRHWRDRHGPNGFQCSAERQDRLAVPWLSLILTCKTIACEIKSMTAASSELQTWTLDLRPTRGGSCLGPLTWHCIPCAPQHVQTVIATIEPSDSEGERAFELRFWGDGGPKAITRSLYQTLNHLVHCGPRMNAQRELESPLHIKKLILRVTIPDFGEDDQDRKYAVFQRRMQSARLNSFLETIAGQGMAFGMVDRLVLQMNGEEKEAVSQDRGPWTMPDFWDRYGFDWGMATYRADAE